MKISMPLRRAARASALPAISRMMTALPLATASTAAGALSVRRPVV
jgi:hypothetical protein